MGTLGKLLLISGYFAITPLLLLLSSILLLSLSYQKSNGNMPLSFFSRPQNVAYAALPSSTQYLTQEIQAQDARVEILRQFFEEYNSPLEPYAQNFVTEADTYGLDFRLLPSIAMQESNLCKRSPHNSNNCWGFGIYGGKVKTFPSYPDAITVISKTLAKEYKGKGLVEPAEIMTKYTPSSNGSWARGVNYFMDQLE